MLPPLSGRGKLGVVSRQLEESDLVERVTQHGDGGNFVRAVTHDQQLNIHPTMMSQFPASGTG